LRLGVWPRWDTPFYKMEADGHAHHPEFTNLEGKKKYCWH
jgi:hypothetical protein